MNVNLLEIINEWNPVEIFPLLENEYQYEVRKIQDGFSKNQTVQSLEERRLLVCN